MWSQEKQQFSEVLVLFSEEHNLKYLAAPLKTFTLHIYNTHTHTHTQNREASFINFTLLRSAEKKKIFTQKNHFFKVKSILKYF